MGLWGGSADLQSINDAQIGTRYRHSFFLPPLLCSSPWALPSASFSLHYSLHPPLLCFACELCASYTNKLHCDTWTRSVTPVIKNKKNTITAQLYCYEHVPTPSEIWGRRWRNLATSEITHDHSSLVGTLHVSAKSWLKCCRLGFLYK